MLELRRVVAVAQHVADAGRQIDHGPATMEEDDLVPCRVQPADDVRSDEPGPANEQDAHHSPPVKAGALATSVVQRRRDRRADGA